jgi:anti-anti-sigma regulatory factor
MKAQRDVVVDLSELVFADASLMLDLAALARRLRRRGRVVWLRNPQPHIRVLIELVGLHRLDGIQLQAPAAALT